MRSVTTNRFLTLLAALGGLAFIVFSLFAFLPSAAMASALPWPPPPVEWSFGPRHLDLDFYAASRDSLRDASKKKLSKHYRESGLEKGKAPNFFFNPKYYLEANPDIAKRYGKKNYLAASKHWLKHGIKEGRRGSKYFDVRFYLQDNPDLQAQFGPEGYEAAMNHFARHGRFEGRRPAAEVAPYPTVDIGLRDGGRLMGKLGLARKGYERMKEVIDDVGRVLIVKELYDTVREPNEPAPKENEPKDPAGIDGPEKDIDLDLDKNSCP